jgi:hypothetical protein
VEAPEFYSADFWHNYMRNESAARQIIKDLDKRDEKRRKAKEADARKKKQSRFTTRSRYGTLQGGSSAATGSKPTGIDKQKRYVGHSNHQGETMKQKMERFRNAQELGKPSVAKFDQCVV